MKELKGHKALSTHNKDIKRTRNATQVTESNTKYEIFHFEFGLLSQIIKKNKRKTDWVWSPKNTFLSQLLGFPILWKRRASQERNTIVMVHACLLIFKKCPLFFTFLIFKLQNYHNKHNSNLVSLQPCIYICRFT